MKIIVFLSLFLMSVIPSFANNEPFCLEKAKEWQQLLHQKRLSDAGHIQGYVENTRYEFKTFRHDMDNFTETVEFFVNAQNVYGSTWTWVYEVTIDTWIGGNGQAWVCDVLKAQYKGAF